MSRFLLVLVKIHIAWVNIKLHFIVLCSRANFMFALV